MKSYKYKSYDQYVSEQIKANEIKNEKRWVRSDDILFLSGFIFNLMTPELGLCMGSKNGYEQRFFMTYLPGCQVIGFEIGKSTDEVNTIQWDFNRTYKKFIGKVDFIYSNSFDHVYDPKKTLGIWLSYLNDTGILILEHTIKHTGTPTKIDPVKFGKRGIIKLLKKIDDDKWYVSDNLRGPYENILDTGSVKKTVPETRFFVIKRRNACL